MIFMYGYFKVFTRLPSITMSTCVLSNAKFNKGLGFYSESLKSKDADFAWVN